MAPTTATANTSAFTSTFAATFTTACLVFVAVEAKRGAILQDIGAFAEGLTKWILHPDITNNNKYYPLT